MEWRTRSWRPCWELFGVDKLAGNIAAQMAASSHVSDEGQHVALQSKTGKEQKKLHRKKATWNRKGGRASRVAKRWMQAMGSRTHWTPSSMWAGRRRADRQGWRRGSASVVPADSDSVVPADSVSVVPAAVWVVRSTTVPLWHLQQNTLVLSILKSVLLLTCTLSSSPHPTPPFGLIYAQVCLAPDLYVIIPTPPHPTLVGRTEPKFRFCRYKWDKHL